MAPNYRIGQLFLLRASDPADKKNIIKSSLPFGPAPLFTVNPSVFLRNYLASAVKMAKQVRYAAKVDLNKDAAEQPHLHNRWHPDSS